MSKFEVLDYQLEGKNFKFETCLKMIADALAKEWLEKLTEKSANN